MFISISELEAVMSADKPLGVTIAPPPAVPVPFTAHAPRRSKLEPLPRDPTSIPVGPVLFGLEALLSEIFPVFARMSANSHHMPWPFEVELMPPIPVIVIPPPFAVAIICVP